MFSNYYPDTNPFCLAPPPSWWLRKLHEFDDSLVVVPSRQSCVYRLAQRRTLSLPERITNDSLFNQSDTRMLASYSLIPVTTIIASPNWSNPLMWGELASRAPWRMGGADKVNRMQEEADARDEARKAEATSQHLTDVSKDGWKYYQAKTGARTHMNSQRRDPRIILSI